MIPVRHLQCLKMVFKLYMPRLITKTNWITSINHISACRVRPYSSSTCAVGRNVSGISNAPQFQNILSIDNNMLSRVVFQMERRMLSSVLNIDRNLTKNILVFSYENDSFYKFLTVFGVLQMFALVTWGYLSLSPMPNLTSDPIFTDKEVADLPWWQRWLYKDGCYNNAINGICLTVGTSAMVATFFYPQRAIRNLWLLKGGKKINIETHGLFGRNHTQKVTLDHMSCFQPRVGPGGQIPLKIKGRKFFFLLDKKGTFHNPEIFDFVIGLKRKL